MKIYLAIMVPLISCSTNNFASRDEYGNLTLLALRAQQPTTTLHEEFANQQSTISASFETGVKASAILFCIGSLGLLAAPYVAYLGLTTFENPILKFASATSSIVPLAFGAIFCAEGIGVAEWTTEQLNENNSDEPTTQEETV